MVDVTFWGVRGSTPCPCDANVRYGGNTACVALEARDHDPIIFDLGTGLRFFGEQVQARGGAPVRALALVTHLHWDHIQGLPFFTPIHVDGAHLDVRGRAECGTLAAAFGEFMRPPFFPVTAAELGGDIVFVDAEDEVFAWGRAEVTVRDVPHVGATNGYRVDLDGVSVAYVSDHQQPAADAPVAASVLELCRDADLVIHDAQYEPHEFEAKVDWGHCTVAYAVRVAAEAGARRLALFHHDPAHGDDVVDRMLAEAVELAAGTSVEEVIAASERLTVSLSPATSTASASSASSAAVASARVAG